LWGIVAFGGRFQLAGAAHCENARSNEPAAISTRKDWNLFLCHWLPLLSHDDQGAKDSADQEKDQSLAFLRIAAGISIFKEFFVELGIASPFEIIWPDHQSLLGPTDSLIAITITKEIVGRNPASQRGFAHRSCTLPF
jgi:hypothetical protein